MLKRINKELKELRKLIEDPENTEGIADLIVGDNVNSFKAVIKGPVFMLKER